MAQARAVVDGNEAVASVAYRLNEVIAIYPITPSSTMGELADQWKAGGATNIWGTVPDVIEMQSEGGAAGALHGALQGGALATTFTASQGLLLMIPNMYKIAGELTAAVIHVAARTIATHALSIFGDHSDVMAARTTGFALLAANSVQEACDFALVAQAATLESRVPFLHFFDGFRTSHEIATIESLSDDDLRAIIDNAFVVQHRERAMSPDRPVLRGTAHNPDMFFQAREASNPYYRDCPTIVQDVMDRLARRTGRAYRLFDYYGAPDADRVLVLMGSGAGAAEEVVDALQERGERVGIVKVRLFRPFAIENFLAALPATVRSIAVLDRTKEPGSIGEPLYQDVITALMERHGSGAGATMQRVIGGRYGLASKEFTPAMVKAVFDELAKAHPKRHFTVGILDDITHTSLDCDTEFSTEHPRTVRAVFFGLGSDGTIGANKNSIKIIGKQTRNYVQGYFVYDSKKAGAVTVSHLRFGLHPIKSTYLIGKANFVACHQFQFLKRIDVLLAAEPGATFLLNAPFGADEIWDHLPGHVQDTILRKKLKFYVIDAFAIARECGIGTRINTIMQTCFFALSGVLPRDEAIAAIKEAIEDTYGKRGSAAVQKNFAAVDRTLTRLHEVPLPLPHQPSGSFDMPIPVAPAAPEFVKNVLGKAIAGRGDTLPVSAMPIDGTFPTGTAKWEKRNIAQQIPVWDLDLCIQCGKCVLVCPHSVIRAKIYDASHIARAPSSFKAAKPKWREFESMRYTLQVSPQDCTGCNLCVEACPVRSKSEAKHKAINMEPQAPLCDTESTNWEFFLSLPELDRGRLSHDTVKNVQVLEPLFEFSGACAGCGETPYIKLLTQLFGDRLLIANATGCSSIYGGNLPTTPYTANAQGRGPAWSNSLFEDNAEFGLGMRLAVDKQTEFAREMVARLSADLGDALATGILQADQSTEAGIDEQRRRVAELKRKLVTMGSSDAAALRVVADALVRRSVWLVGGDGWAYDIGAGGLDHVLESGRNVNVLVLDTEVYSNTGGQMSKATPRGAIAKFSTGGKHTAKKDLAMEAVNYGSVYVARVAMGGNDIHAVRTFLEAESYDGPSIIIAYSHCIAHGYDMSFGLAQQRSAVLSGYWPLMRYDPRLQQDGKNPFQLDSMPPSIAFRDYAYQEARYTMLARSNPEAASALLVRAQQDVERQWRIYANRAAMAGHVAPADNAPSESQVSALPATESRSL